MRNDIAEKKEQLFDKPIDSFKNWMELAQKAKLLKPIAFCLSTIGLDGSARGRVLLNKGVVDDNIVFYTNYASEKGKEIAANNKVSATFYWDEPLDCQVRIEGHLERLSSELSDVYFASRPRGAKIGAWASPQSGKIESREALEKLVNEMEAKFEGVEDVPRPEFWGGYKLVAKRYDFMLMRKDRLHDRYQYSLNDGLWDKQLLAP